MSASPELETIWTAIAAVRDWVDAHVRGVAVSIVLVEPAIGARWSRTVQITVSKPHVTAVVVYIYQGEIFAAAEPAMPLRLGVARGVLALRALIVDAIHIDDAAVLAALDAETGKASK